jgi:hypothetical protein
MTKDEIKNTVLPHLRNQFERGFPILFTGAGFSLGAKTRSGHPVLTVDELKKELWSICFPDEAFELGTTLQDLYDTALRYHKTRLGELLTRSFTVDPDSLPDWYRTFFSMPWSRCYTVNIDDLDAASSRRFALPRRVQSISATSSSEGARAAGDDPLLDSVHLNGSLADVPDNVTFSVLQYSERLLRAEPWYVRLMADLVTRSLVFVGTKLDEPPLWQHLEMRRNRGARGTRELRPRSYLVTPQLDRARVALLSEFNVSWLPMTGEEFASEVLSHMDDAVAKGIALVTRSTRNALATPVTIPEVSSLAAGNPDEKTEFLLGQEPAWADLHSGRAIERQSDAGVWQLTKAGLDRKDCKGLVVITGTAGSGKSAALMRVALRLVAEGTRAGWIDKESRLSHRDIRQAIRGDDAPSVLCIDDADLLGNDLSNLVREICLSGKFPLVIVAIRSTRLDRFLNFARLERIPRDDIAMPPLSDSDIAGLIDALDNDNRLGVLKGLPRVEQEKAFRNNAGRQLLVAMIQATSGRRFEEKVMDELAGLEPDAQFVYALVMVASNFRCDLSRQDLLVGSGDQSNLALNLVDQLVKRHVIFESPSRDGSVRARHRVIADIVVNELQKTGQLAPVLMGLARIAAVKVNPSMPRSARPWRLVRLVISHDFLKRTIGPQQARNLYASVEPLLEWDGHYWLQRGSLEVEEDRLNLAGNFLGQARSLSPDDPLVENEWAYLLFRKAILSPGASDAPRMAGDAIAILRDLIDSRGDGDPYPFHVLGSQGLSWCRRGISKRDDKISLLRDLLAHVKDGCKRHPMAKDLVDLHRDLERELLSFAV